MRALRLRISFSIALATLVAAGSVSTAAENEAIQNAIKKGVKYLQDVHKPSNAYVGGQHGMGSATLAGLALLEAGVPQTDPALQNIIKYVREKALGQNGAHETYEISLTIMFLDQLGNKVDEPIIQVLGIRLMSGQTENGGWSYTCSYRLNPEDEARLRIAFSKETQLESAPGKKKVSSKIEARPDLPNPTEEPSNPSAAPKSEERPPLHPEVARWARIVNLQNQGRPNGDGDNSNTQFATLGLWCAYKHGVPCENALALIGQRFRLSQSIGDGGWNYTFGAGREQSTASMTCAGLIGLAVAEGTALNRLQNRANVPKKDVPNGKKVPDDEAIKRGLKCLGNFVSEAKANNGERRRFVPESLAGDLYFLWSLERVCVIYSLETIGKQDWYQWGADQLLNSQQADGSWPPSKHIGDIDVSTSLALLFLRRANVARDLSTALKGKVQDPGLAVLRGGGNIGNNPPAQSGADFEAEAAKLTAAVIAAAADDRTALLAKLRDNKGSFNTEALARAAAKLTGDSQQQARDALTQRLTRMTATTLGEMLKDENREIRLAAAAACGKKDDKQYIPHLIKLLDDSESLVVRAARTSLVALSKQDFGPEPDAAPGDKTKAILAWKNWWKTQMN